MLLKAIKALYPNVSDEALVPIINNLLLDLNATPEEIASWLQGLLTGYVIAESIKSKTNDKAEEI